MNLSELRRLAKELAKDEGWKNRTKNASRFCDSWLHLPGDLIKPNRYKRTDTTYVMIGAYRIGSSNNNGAYRLLRLRNGRVHEVTCCGITNVDGERRRNAPKLAELVSNLVSNEDWDQAEILLKAVALDKHEKMIQRLKSASSADEVAKILKHLPKR